MCGPKPGLKVIYNTVAPPQTEQEVLTLSENRSLLKFFSGCSLYSIFSFLVAFCRSLYVFVFFLFTIILSVHQFTAFEHPFFWYLQAVSGIIFVWKKACNMANSIGHLAFSIVQNAYTWRRRTVQ